MMNKRHFSLLMAMFLVIGLSAQAPKRYNAAEIYEGIEKLNFLGSVLYVAAHPDDENTFVISYLANEVKARTAYLSLTRGDGGQNLIGPELKELLGVIRTQELLAARRLDGGEQMFSRAYDFGYSKNSEETLEIWNREAVLGDVVWAIRTYQPDVVINRFSHQSSGKTHGHHSASAELSYDAFDLSANPDAYPEQLAYTEPYQARRLFFNTSYWFYGRDREAFAKVDKSDMVKVNVGTYYEHKGMSNNELAAYSRSQHVCQGMGRTPKRGDDIEYLQILKGDMPKDDKDLFDGINTTWSRLPGAAAIQDMVDEVLQDYDFRRPGKSAAGLAKVCKAIEALPPSMWRTVKLKEAKALLAAVSGLFLEATVNGAASVVQGEDLNLQLELVNRSDAAVQVEQISFAGMRTDTVLGQALANNDKLEFKLKAKVPNDAAITDPYWLRNKGSAGMFDVADQMLIGMPETPRSLIAGFKMNIEGYPMVFDKVVMHKATDRERGEVYSPLEVTSRVAVEVGEPVYIFADSRAKRVEVTVTAGDKAVQGKVFLPVEEGWTVQPKHFNVALTEKGEEATFSFLVEPPAGASVVSLEPYVEIDGQRYDREWVRIDYQHIAAQLVTRRAQAKAVKLDIQKGGQKIAYVQGAGDAIPASLRQIGYTVDVLEVEDIQSASLAAYDAVILGIRAYNKHEDLQYKQDMLWDYVSNGGTLLTQYITYWGLKADEIAPYHIKLSRDRVTVEEAPVTLLAPDHPMLSYPNRIGQSDFDGWVQERGLYFSNEWDKAYTPLLACNDPGESSKSGGLLVAKHGKGYFVYTGYSFFRQLPAGVPGAYRLFTNLISQTPRKP